MIDYYEQQAKNGKRGGKKVLKKYGRDHFSELGRKGSQKRWEK